MNDLNADDMIAEIDGATNPSHISLFIPALLILSTEYELESHYW
jgi:hypothetical protein